MGYGSSLSTFFPPSLLHLTLSSPPPLAVIGKSEGQGTDHHGHLTALTVAPEFRRLALATSFMSNLEFASASSTHNGYFLDLFVRCNNAVAIPMYEKLGYTVFRRVVGYYQGIAGEGKDGEDAFGECTTLVLDQIRGRRSERSDGGELEVLLPSSLLVLQALPLVRSLAVLDSSSLNPLFSSFSFPPPDMRKPLPRDVERASIRPNGRNFRVKPSDVWF